MIIFSDSGVVETSFSATDNEDCVDELSTILQTVGWTYIGAVTGGHKLEFTSKQGLQARATLVASTVGLNELAALTVMSADESVVGTPFYLRCLPGQPDFTVIANECQMFVFLPGFSDDAWDGVNYNHNWACGIPYVMQTEVADGVAGECGIVDNAVTTMEAWWSTGAAGVGLPETFRWKLTTHRNAEACSWNYDLTANVYTTAARIFPTRHAQRPFFDAAHDETRWANGDPLYLDPYIGWGDSLGNHAKFRGQIYDAFLASCDMPLEDTITMDEPRLGGGTTPVSYINYTHPNVAAVDEGTSYAGSLYLRRGVTIATGSGLANYLHHG